MFLFLNKHHDQEPRLGGKNLFSLHFSVAVHQQRKSRLELKQVRKQELMQRPYVENSAEDGGLACEISEGYLKTLNRAIVF